MTARFLLDTNICIYIRQRRPQAVLDRFKGASVGEVALSVITHGELVRGALRSAAPDRSLALLEELTALIPALALPVAAGRHYGDIRHDLERRGEIIGNNDLWIAAHARAADLTLVTNNAREFARVRGLRVDNWI